MPADDIEWLARWAYARGRDPVDYAEQRVAMLIAFHLMIAESRKTKPESFPIYSQDLSTEALSRRVLGHLLSLGWTPPAIDPDAPVPISDTLPGDLDDPDNWPLGPSGGTP